MFSSAVQDWRFCGKTHGPRDSILAVKKLASVCFINKYLMKMLVHKKIWVLHQIIFESVVIYTNLSCGLVIHTTSSCEKKVSPPAALTCLHMNQNLHWKLGQQTPSTGSWRIWRLRPKFYFFRNKTFLFFKIESWNFQQLFEKEFRETSQNFNSIRQPIEKIKINIFWMSWMSWNSFSNRCWEV